MSNVYDIEVDGVVRISGTAAPPAVFNDLDPDTEYTFRVRARNSAGAGPWSDPLVIKTESPLNPTLDLVANGTSLITLKIGPLSPGYSADLQRRTAGSGSYTPIAFGLAGDTNYTTTKPSNSSAYEYRLVASNLDGDTRISNVVNVPIMAARKSYQVSYSLNPEVAGWQEIVGNPWKADGRPNGRATYALMKGTVSVSGYVMTEPSPGSWNGGSNTFLVESDISGVTSDGAGIGGAEPVVENVGGYGSEPSSRLSFSWSTSSGQSYMFWTVTVRDRGEDYFNPGQAGGTNVVGGIGNMFVDPSEAYYGDIPVGETKTWDIKIGGTGASLGTVSVTRLPDVA